MMQKTAQELLIEFNNELLELEHLVHPDDKGEFFEKLLHIVMLAATWGASLNDK
jgi:hypothetical protein